MKQLIYRAIKTAIGVVLAIFIADLIGLSYSTTAGVIALLSVLDSRKQTYIVGMKRIGTALIAIFLATILFYFGGHNLLVLGIFLILFIPVLTRLNLTEGLSISTVLVTHIYTINALGISVMFNEMGLLLIGVGISWILNLHMLSIEDEIRDLQFEVEELIKSILEEIGLQLINQCPIKARHGIFEELDEKLIIGLNKSVIYDNNNLLKDDSYFVDYFRMRREQYQLLVHIQNHVKTQFISLEKAKPLSNFTNKIAIQLNECNSGDLLLDEAFIIRELYRRSELPNTREEFENRAILYQYLNDIIYFIKIKSDFIKDHGEIKYCSFNGKR